MNQRKAVFVIVQKVVNVKKFAFAGHLTVVAPHVLDHKEEN